MNHSIEPALDAPYAEDDTTPPLTDNAMRPSPRLDPVRRAMLSSLAKWMLLLAGLLLFGFLVGISRQQNSIGEGAGVSYYLAEHFISVLLATLVAMGLPLILLPRVFWQSEDLTDAARKWMITGIVTATLFYGSILFTRQYAREQIYRNVSSGVLKEIANSRLRNPNASAKTPVDVLKGFAGYNRNHPDKPPKTDPSLALYALFAPDGWSEWSRSRLPLALVCAFFGFLSVSLFSQRHNSSARKRGRFLWQTLVQVPLLGLPLFSIMGGVRIMMKSPLTPYILGGFALILFLFSLGVVCWAFSADRTLRALQREGKVTGVAGNAMQLTLTLLGGSSSGKTTLLAGAYRQWTEENTGQIEIIPDPQSPDSATLESVSDLIYIKKLFPPGNLSCSSMGFQLCLDGQTIAYFTLLDYPGGVVSGDNPDPLAEAVFWNRVRHTDGLLLISDMSQIRRKQRYQDDSKVRRAYKTALQTVAKRNGANRIVPVALVHTKVDEYKASDDSIRYTDMSAGLESYGYLGLEEHWKEHTKPPKGPGISRYRTFFCSAIWYSTPKKDSEEQIDTLAPYGFSDVYQPKPAGCLAPLLWICANAMRWNVTLYDDLTGWLWGGSRQAKKRMEAILEMESLANSMETKIRRK